MKCLFLEDYYVEPKHAKDDGTRTLSIYLTRKKFGLTLEINWLE